eukprot:g81910.t1
MGACCSQQDKPEVRFRRFTALQQMTGLPRLPDDEQGLLTTDALPKLRLCVFVSHRWARSKEGYPDHKDNSKFRLLLEGVERLCKRMASTLPLENVFLWVDYSCINQDSAPASELDNLTGIVHECDVLFTPLTGECKGYLMTSGEADTIIGYHNAVWRPLGDHGDGSSYVERGWTRAEMFLGSTAATGGYRRDRRAHFLYSQYESKRLMPPFLLPPLQNSYFEKYNPATGKLTKEEDRQVTQSLVDKLRPRVKMVPEGGGFYEGDWQADKMHGKGKFTYADGDVYQGEWQANQMHGKGKFTYADGDVYEGEYQDGKMHGKCKYTYTHGDVYEGDYQDGKMHGKGRYTYADGGFYEGEWEADQRHGQGKMISPDGEIVYDGMWVNDQPPG